MVRTTRRSFMTTAAKLGIGAAAMSTLARPAIAKGATLTVSTWGGVTQDSVKNFVQPVFEKLTGSTIAYDIGAQGPRYNKLLAQRNNPSIDIFLCGDETAVAGHASGVLAPVSRKAMPNSANIFPGAITVKDGTTEDTIAAIPYAVVAYLLAYNPEIVKTKPSSWADLWRPEFKGKLAMISPAHSMMPAFVILANELAGGTIDNVDPGFKKLAELRPARLTMFWTDWAPMDKTGDVIAATEFDYYLETMKAQNYPIDYVTPKEKGIGAPQVACMVKGAPNAELSEAFLNVMLDEGVQKALAVETFQGPTNTKVVLDGAAAARCTYGDKLAALRFFDPKHRVGIRSKWTERMNIEVAPNWQAR